MKRELEALLSKAVNLIEQEENRLEYALEALDGTIKYLKTGGSHAKGTVADLIAERRDAEEQLKAYNNLGEAIEDAMDV